MVMPIAGAKHTWSVKLMPIVVGLLLVCMASAQAPIAPDVQRGRKGVATSRAVVNFTELARQVVEAPTVEVMPEVIPFMPIPSEYPVPPEALPVTNEKAAVSEQPPPEETPPAALSPATSSSFQALGDNGTRIPPDTMGTVGPNHLMVALNSEVRIQNRSGVETSKVTLNSFWSSTGATGVFDPKLTYDPFNSRWIFTATSNARAASSSVLVGVSQTSDPTGTWNLYRVDADATDTNWADFPSLGFNKDWIVVTVNMFRNAGDAFVQGNVYAFDKTDLYANGTGAFTLFTDAQGGTLAPAVTFDNSLATEYLLKHWNGSSGGSGFLRLSSITGTVGAEVYTAQVTFVSTMNPWSFQPPNGDDFAPQRGTTDKIQNNDSRISNLVYRNGSLWAAQTAFLPSTSPTHAVAQWWQFQDNGDGTASVQQFGRVEDPDGNVFYAFPSIAVNVNNDVLLGYSSFSAAQFASASYSFRASTDPPNTMRPDSLLKAGEATYFKTFTGTENRWGDYSNTVVDPVNDTDMWTIQEYAASPANLWGTWWGMIVPGTPPKKRRGQVTSE